MLRIVAGHYGGRRIQAPPGRGTRPTQEKVRGALFNSLDLWVEWDGVHVVDLYAGSGALGIEALSRGAGHVTFVESDPRTADVIRANLKALGITPSQATVLPLKVLAWLHRAPALPDVHVALLDPPYATGETEDVLRALLAWPPLIPSAVLSVETSSKHLLEPPDGLEVLRAKRYGDTQLVFLKKSRSVSTADPQGSGPGLDSQ
jgi:16S rRNA (guanine966-N2)-methyltransferase